MPVVVPEPLRGPLDRLRRRLQPAWPWVALWVLLLVATGWMVWLTLRQEASGRDDAVDEAAREAAVEVRGELMAIERRIRWLGSVQGLDVVVDEAQAGDLMRAQPSVVRLERRGMAFQLLGVQEAGPGLLQFDVVPRSSLEAETALACTLAARDRTSMFSTSYFVPMAGRPGREVIDLCAPVRDGLQLRGYVVASIALAPLLEPLARQEALRRVELSLVEADGSRLVRAGDVLGAGRHVRRQIIDLPGSALILQADGGPQLSQPWPGLPTLMVLGLSSCLLVLAALLVRDARRRAQAEAALDQALAYRKALGDSMPTPLVALDLEGRVVFSNPAFLRLVGFTQEELEVPVPPFWPPERAEKNMAAYRRDQQRVRLQGATGLKDFEGVVVRKGGERFTARIYQAPLLDRLERHTGWVAAVVDLTEQRRREERERQQQERLQAAARLTTVGELATLVSHELNQPLAAISSYASGSLNLLQAAESQTSEAQEIRGLIGQALDHIAEQAERAGRVIRSVQGFVRRRERHVERLGIDELLETVLPLVRLQAAKSGAHVVLDLPRPCPRVSVDRTMIEQVLLNLTRNALQAMEDNPPEIPRVLTLQARPRTRGGLVFSVIDTGAGIPDEIAARLFTPFFTTKVEGMGMGLSLCRTVIEQHGGTLDFITPHADGRGAEFRFTLQSESLPDPAPAPAPAPSDPLP